MYLVDTKVVSELRKPRLHGAVVAWVESIADSDLYLSAVTLGEIQAGIEMTRERDAAKAADMRLGLTKSLRRLMCYLWIPLLFGCGQS